MTAPVGGDFAISSNTRENCQAGSDALCAYMQFDRRQVFERKWRSWQKRERHIEAIKGAGYLWGHQPISAFHRCRIQLAAYVERDPLTSTTTFDNLIVSANATHSRFRVRWQQGQLIAKLD